MTITKEFFIEKLTCAFYDQLNKICPTKALVSKSGYIVDAETLQRYESPTLNSLITYACYNLMVDKVFEGAPVTLSDLYDVCKSKLTANWSINPGIKPEGSDRVLDWDTALFQKLEGFTCRYQKSDFAVVLCAIVTGMEIREIEVDETKTFIDFDEAIEAIDEMKKSIIVHYEDQVNEVSERLDAELAKKNWSIATKEDIGLGNTDIDRMIAPREDETNNPTKAE